MIHTDPIPSSPIVRSYLALLPKHKLQNYTFYQKINNSSYYYIGKKKKHHPITNWPISVSASLFFLLLFFCFVSICIFRYKSHAMFWAGGPYLDSWRRSQNHLSAIFFSHTKLPLNGTSITSPTLYLIGNEIASCKKVLLINFKYFNYEYY